jgi:hypothetical protein
VLMARETPISLMQKPPPDPAVPALPTAPASRRGDRLPRAGETLGDPFAIWTASIATSWKKRPFTWGTGSGWHPILLLVTSGCQAKHCPSAAAILSPGCLTIGGHLSAPHALRFS